MDVAGWLRGLGLGKYEAAFLDNGIGEAVLPHLTVEDLKELGVATVGDRRMLLAAIAAWATPTSSEPIGPQPSPALPIKAPEVSAERRRTDEIAEHHRDRTALSRDFGTLGRRRL